MINALFTTRKHTAFYMVGDIKDVQEKATKMAKSLEKKTGGAAAAAAAAQYSLGGQAEIISKGLEQYGLKSDKSQDQIKAEIEPWMVPPSLVNGFSAVPGVGSDLSDAEIKEKFKEAFNALSDDQKRVSDPFKCMTCVCQVATYSFCIHVCFFGRAGSEGVCQELPFQGLEEVHRSLR